MALSIEQRMRLAAVGFELRSSKVAAGMIQQEVLSNDSIDVFILSDRGDTYVDLESKRFASGRISLAVLASFFEGRDVIDQVEQSNDSLTAALCDHLDEILGFFSSPAELEKFTQFSRAMAVSRS